jgi:hypothetical protein
MVPADKNSVTIIVVLLFCCLYFVDLLLPTLNWSPILINIVPHFEAGVSIGDGGISIDFFSKVGTDLTNVFVSSENYWPVQLVLNFWLAAMPSMPPTPL